MDNPTDTRARVSVFMCGRGRHKGKKLFNCQTCFKLRSEFRCRRPINGSETCDRHLCGKCAIKIGDDLYICPEHRSEAETRIPSLDS